MRLETAWLSQYEWADTILALIVVRGFSIRATILFDPAWRFSDA